MRRATLLLLVLGLMAAGISGAAATTSVYDVEFSINSHTGGSGIFYITGHAVGNESGATGEFIYDRPENSVQEALKFRAYDLKCVTVVPSVVTSYDTDYNVMIIGRIEALIDPTNYLDGYDWAWFAYAPDTPYITSRPIGVRPHDYEPSCDPATYFSNIDNPMWRTAGVWDPGSYITVTENPDSDGDGVLDADDMCPATTLDDPPDLLKRNRFAADAAGLFVDVNGTESGFSVIDTFGCDEDQIIDLLGLGAGHVKFGITRSALQQFISMY